MHLDRFQSNVDSRLRSHEFRLCSRFDVVLMLILHPGSAIHKDASSLEAGGHVSQLHLDGLQVGDRLAERFALGGISESCLEGPFGDTKSLSGDTDTATVEGLHGDLEAFAQPRRGFDRPGRRRW